MSQIPYGYCHCGCGGETNAAVQTNKKHGYIKGQLMRFILGHHTRVQVKKSLVDRFWSKVNVTSSTDECWEWQCGRNSDGYGHIGVNGKTMSSHRVAYELSNGEIPDGLQVLHSCDNPGCVNPSHLFLGTHLDNMKDRMNKGHNPKDSDYARGEDLPQHKLTYVQVQAIRDRYKTGGITQRKLASEYGVGQSQIARIVNFKNWENREEQVG